MGDVRYYGKVFVIKKLMYIHIVHLGSVVNIIDWITKQMEHYVNK